MKEDTQRKADLCHDVNEILKKAFREINAMYPIAPLQVILIPLASNLAILSIASGISKEELIRCVERTYEIHKDSVSDED